jgi:hypothetical protein
MTSITFDTLGYFERLKAAGMPESQARVQAETLREVIEDKLATKQDLRELEYRLKADLIRWMVGLTMTQIAVSLALFAIR